MRRASVAVGFCIAVLLLVGPARSGERERVTVYKSPTCGCCDKWIDHLKANGFPVVAHEVKDVRPVKRENGLPPQLSSCHTALVGGYVVEGHVPASDITRLLESRPPVSGLAVPRMPIGSPGMEGPNPVPYRVFSFDAKGQIETFSTHTP
jgi:hypothetical protein